MPSRPPGPSAPDPKRPAPPPAAKGGAKPAPKPAPAPSPKAAPAKAVAPKTAAKPGAPKASAVPAASTPKSPAKPVAPAAPAPGAKAPAKGLAKAPATPPPPAKPGVAPKGTPAATPAPVARKAAAAKPSAPPEPPAPARPRKFPKGGPGKSDLKRLRARLEALLTGNRRSSEDLEREALQSSGHDVSVDHMADHGTDSFEQDFTLGLLEGKTEMAREIQDAIDKIDGKGELPYGVCEACADRPPERWARGCETCPWIPTARLDVMPHARLCTRRQEEAEGDR